MMQKPTPFPPSAGRILRLCLTMDLCLIFAILFLYDGYAGYPSKNIRALADGLDPRPEGLPVLNRAIEESSLSADKAVGQTLAELERELGPPGWRGADQAAWFGPGGAWVVKMNLAGRATASEWRKGPKDPHWQLLIGYPLVVLAALALAHFVWVMARPVRLTPDTLTIPGHGRFPRSAIRDIEMEEVGGKVRRLRLHIDAPGGRRGITLDDYRVARLGEIAAALREGGQGR